jgi:ribosomal protein S18 acetylase RimI-like enzyme
MHIRPALDGPADWRRLRLESLRESPRAFGSTLAREQAFTDADWETRIGDLSFVAYDVDVPVGLGGGYRPQPGRIEVVSMWVRPGHRGRGLSRMLLDAIVGGGRRENATFELYVDRTNAAARGAYLSYGFVPTGETKSLSADPEHLAERMVLPPRGDR